MQEIIAYNHRLTRILYTAAAFCLILTVCAAYLYQKATPINLYTDNYRSYQRHIVRGTDERSNLKTAYSDGRMDEVIAYSKTAASLSQEDRLLTATALLQKNRPKEAITMLTALNNANLGSGNSLYADDDDYYLAMSYLAYGQSALALPILEKIHADRDHVYNSQVSAWLIMMTKVSTLR